MLSHSCMCMQATILHLRERIGCLEFNETQLTESKHQEDQLSQQIKLLSDQLVEAKTHHAPVSSTVVRHHN